MSEKIEAAKPNITIHNNRMYSRIDSGLWQGWVPSTTPVLTDAPFIKWMGRKIPYKLFCEIISFFRHVYDKDKDECQVRMFYHTEHGWGADALPQRGIGMTTKELPDHPDFGPAMQKWLSDGWEPAGSGHHHNNTSAFQSGTDSSDETGSGAGLHFTVGKLGDKDLDFHARLIFRGQQYAATIIDYVDVPLPENIPGDKDLHDLIRKHMLNRPPSVPFPSEWLTRIIKTYNTLPPHTYGYGGGQQQSFFPACGHGTSPVAGGSRIIGTTAAFSYAVEKLAETPIYAASVAACLKDMDEFFARNSKTCLDDAFRLKRLGASYKDILDAVEKSDAENVAAFHGS